MQNSFTIKQDLTVKELIRCTVYYFLASKGFKIYFIGLTAVMLLSSVLGAVTTDKGFETSGIITTFVTLIFMLILLVGFASIVSIFMYRSKPNIFTNVYYDFTHWGMIRHAEGKEHAKQWREISKIKETGSFFFLYIKGFEYHIVQKRMFADAQELNAFREFLKENSRQGRASKR